MAKTNLYAEKDKELFGEVRKLKDQTSGDFNRVFDLSKKYIHKIIYDIVKNEDDTEDIMQETYLQIYNKIDTLEKPDAFYVWAGRIATNKTLRYIQKNRREMLVEADEDGETDFVFERMSEDTEKFIPEAVLMDMEKQRIIADILDKLPLEQKICVQFFYYEEMSVKEIAQAFGCSEGTVKSRLNYARKAIKDAVIDMDVKHGTRLYSLAAVPLCWIVFRNMLAGAIVVAPVSAAGGSIIKNLVQSVVKKPTAGGALHKGAAETSKQGIGEGIKQVGTNGIKQGAEQAGANGIKQSAEQVGANGIKQSVEQTAKHGIRQTVSKLAGTTGGKAAIGITAAAVVAGGGYAVYQANQAEPEPDYTNMIAIYYEIPATRFGYADPFWDGRDDIETVLDAYVGADPVTGAENFFHQKYADGWSYMYQLEEKWSSPQSQQATEIWRQDFKNIVDFMENTADMEYARKFYEENAEKYISEKIPEKEKFDEMPITDRYSGEYRSTVLNAYVQFIEKRKNEWTEIKGMFPDTAELVIDGNQYDFAIEGKYVFMGGEYVRYQDDVYAEKRSEANAANNPVVNRDIYENGIIYADRVIFCVYGHISGEADISDSKYVQYKGEDGEWHYYADRWTGVSVPDEAVSEEMISEQREEFVAPNYCMRISFEPMIFPDGTLCVNPIDIRARIDGEDGKVQGYYGRYFEEETEIGIDELYTPANRIWTVVEDYVRAEAVGIDFLGNVEKCKDFYENMEKLIGPGIYFTVGGEEYYFQFDYTNSWKMAEQSAETMDYPNIRGEDDAFESTFSIYGDLLSGGEGGEDILPNIPVALPFYIYIDDDCDISHPDYGSGEHEFVLGNSTQYFIFDVVDDDKVAFWNTLDGEGRYIEEMSGAQRDAFNLENDLKERLPVLSKNSQNVNVEDIIHDYIGDTFIAVYDGYKYSFTINYQCSKRAVAYSLEPYYKDTAAYQLELIGIAYRID